MENKKSEEILYNSRKALAALLQTYWDVLYFSETQKEFGNRDEVKIGWECIEEIDKHLVKLFKERELLSVQEEALNEMIACEKKHWIENGEPVNHVYSHLVKMRNGYRILKQIKKLIP